MLGVALGQDDLQSRSPGILRARGAARLIDDEAPIDVLPPPKSSWSK